MKYPIPTILLGVAVGIFIVVEAGCTKQVLSTDATTAAQRGAEVLPGRSDSSRSGRSARCERGHAD